MAAGSPPNALPNSPHQAGGGRVGTPTRRPVVATLPLRAERREV
jgi:hypothetical protein